MTYAAMDGQTQDVLEQRVLLWEWQKVAHVVFRYFLGNRSEFQRKIIYNAKQNLIILKWRNCYNLTAITGDFQAVKRS
jgi:hypothetical protein